MTTELLEIQPRLLKFTFELKKQSSCSVILTNKTEQYVAFKVKTTSPRKYVVCPNSGVIKPKSSFSFTVTMQAQKVAPPEMQSKDKFLVQSTLVPFGTSEDEISSNIFSKESGYYIEEKKIRVSFAAVSPLQSPLNLPTDGQKQDTSLETLARRDRVDSEVENIAPPQTVSENKEGLEAEMISQGHLKETNKTDTSYLYNRDGQTNETNCQDPNITLEELRSKLRVMDIKLKEADLTIQKLTEERRAIKREKEKLERDLELLRKSRTKKVQVGFPLLYLFIVALISIIVGFLASY
ncbi:hypothetical protein SAY87_009313 [Trapa incisa]|uniref:MSP domain-containing protein n=1 Tax=Trapa incisa TaxID=236973 RepID=A0AAN7JWD7_9MYRT|nr:hypothetical protein SAY87_009313 [Trapa incisa]